VKRRDVEAHLRQCGAIVVREGARHTVYKGPNGGTGVLPRHREVKDHTIESMCRDLGVPSPFTGRRR
jgi:mRNA interferase HicA